jgi:hypothetical protein
MPSFSLCPGAANAPRNNGFESLGRSFQDLFFHESEIIRLDMKNSRKPAEKPENSQISNDQLSVNPANRGES